MNANHEIFRRHRQANRLMSSRSGSNYKLTHNCWGSISVNIYLAFPCKRLVPTFEHTHNCGTNRTEEPESPANRKSTPAVAQIPEAAHEKNEPRLLCLVVTVGGNWLNTKSD